jgi:O-antigen ligase
MTRRADRVLWVLQATILLLPLFLGGRQPAVLGAAWIVMAALIAVTLVERRRAGRPTTPGAWALATFLALGLFTALPLPPAIIERLAPATAQLYRDVLPGWPGDGGWTAWRSLALDPFAVWAQLSTLAVGFGAYLVLVGYPWGDEVARARVFGRVFLTVLSGGVAMALLALLAEVAGNGQVMWVSDEPVVHGRLAAPFVNPNHLACWLEMVIPATLAYAWVLARRLRRQIVRSVESGRRLALRPRRAWAGALIASQRRLALPFLAAAGAALLVTVHLGTQSRGGTAGLLVGLGVAAGGILASLARRRQRRVPRWMPVAAAFALLLAALVPVGLWMQADSSEVSGADEVDVSLSSRLAVALQGTGIVRDHPLLGTGLGSWLHAFRGYVGPPVEGGIWDHAHDEYLELAAETGALGVALAALFAIGLVRAVRSARRHMLLADGRRERRSRSLGEMPDWQAALGDHRTLAWGLAGGIAAVLVHSTMEFGLHMPANFVLLMVLVGLVVVALPAREGRASSGLAAFAGLGLAAAVPLVWNSVLLVSGAMPLSPDGALAAADRAFSENQDAPRAQALVVAAIDRSPAYRDAHEMLAKVLGPGPGGDEALRRALRLEPWYIPGRDDLAFRLWRRGEREAAAVELEESLYRFPYLASHAFLGPDAALTSSEGPYVVRALADGDIVTAHLVSLDPALTDAIARGLDRALAEATAGEKHTSIVADRVTLLEARERWVEAANMLRAEARLDDTDDRSLGHAARDYLKVNDLGSAEQALLAALLRNPARGSLYQRLAVDVYAVQGNFPLAEKVVQAGERNAVDMLPVYDASSDVIAKREQAWSERVASREPGPELPGGWVPSQ